MASELRVNTLKDASGNNSVATSVVFNGTAKAWSRVELVGTASIIGSYNVSSLTDVGTGIGRSNFSNAFNAADYAVTAGAGLSGDVLAPDLGADSVQVTTSFYLTARANESTSAVDADILTGIALGDLA
tara:strand:+ start:763 stop:1149 length:387 start_codon:yes stop_codon:yes gene_type:complete